MASGYGGAKRSHVKGVLSAVDLRLKMDALVSDLSHALDESQLTPYHRKRRGLKRRSKTSISIGLPHCARGPSDDSSSSVGEVVLSQENKSSLPLSDSDELTPPPDPRMRVPPLLHRRLPANLVESDSFNENFSPARPHNKRKQKWKRMALDPDAPSTSLERSPFHASVRKRRSIRASPEAENKSESSSESEAGVYTCDEGREADDEQSDWFAEPGAVYGVPGAQSSARVYNAEKSFVWWNEDNMGLSPSAKALFKEKYEKMSQETHQACRLRFQKLRERLLVRFARDLRCKHVAYTPRILHNHAILTQSDGPYRTQLSHTFPANLLSEISTFWCLEGAQCPSAQYKMRVCAKKSGGGGWRREIRAGRRRLQERRPGFSIISSVNEKVSRFLQDPAQFELRLKPMTDRDRDQLRHLAKLYSLNVRPSEDLTAPILTKTRKTITTTQLDSCGMNEGSFPGAVPVPLSDLKRRRRTPPPSVHNLTEGSNDSIESVVVSSNAAGSSLRPPVPTASWGDDDVGECCADSLSERLADSEPDPVPSPTSLGLHDCTL